MPAVVSTKFHRCLQASVFRSSIWNKFFVSLIRLMKNKCLGSVFNITTTVMSIVIGNIASYILTSSLSAAHRHHSPNILRHIHQPDVWLWRWSITCLHSQTFPHLDSTWRSHNRWFSLHPLQVRKVPDSEMLLTSAISCHTQLKETEFLAFYCVFMT